MQQAIEASGSIDDATLAAYLGSHVFKTVIGDVAFGKDGEWAAPRMIVTQFQNIKSNSLDQFKDPNTEVVLLPAEFSSGKLIYPVSDRPHRDAGFILIWAHIFLWTRPLPALTCINRPGKRQNRSRKAESPDEVLMDVFQEAAKAAQRRHGDGWLVLSPQEQTRCIYEEMRRIDAEIAEPPSSVPHGKSRERPAIVGWLPRFLLPLPGWLTVAGGRSFATPVRSGASREGRRSRWGEGSFIVRGKPSKSLSLRGALRLAMTGCSGDPPHRGNALAYRQNLCCCLGEHRTTQGDVRLVGVLGPMMADAADARHEQHRRRQPLGKDLRVVAGPARHPHDQRPARDAPPHAPARPGIRHPSRSAASATTPRSVTLQGPCAASATNASSSSVQPVQHGRVGVAELEQHLGPAGDDARRARLQR